MENIDQKIIEIDAKLDKHISVDGVKMDIILDKVDLIENNHLAHIQASMATLSTDSAKSATNIDWLMRSYWVLLTATLGGFIASLIKLFIK